MEAGLESRLQGCGDLDVDGRALHSASYRGQHEKLNLLIAFGHDVNKKNNAGCTALHLACIRGAGHPRCVKLLLAAGADVDAISTNGSTPLSVACFWKHGICARLLVQAGANVHALFPPGSPLAGLTLLQWAAKSQSKQDAVADRLVRKGLYASRQICFCMKEGGRGQDNAGGAWYNGAAQVVLQGALHWSPQTHKLFPTAARARAVQLLILVYLMNRSDHVPIPLDLWLVSVFPHVVGRAIEW